MRANDEHTIIYTMKNSTVNKTEQCAMVYYQNHCIHLRITSLLYASFDVYQIFGVLNLCTS